MVNNSFEGGIFILGKYVIDYIFVVVFFCIIELCFFIKDYNELMIVNEFVRYELQSKNITSLKTEDYSVSIEGNGTYNITFKRKSIFSLQKYKTINYGGIVK